MNVPTAYAYDIEALRARDPEAMTRLVHDVTPRVHRLIYKLIGNTDETKNLVQETLYQAFRSMKSFRGQSKVTTWVCGIATKQALRHLRTVSRRRMVYLDAYDHTPFHPVVHECLLDREPTRHPEQALEANEQTRLIRAAVDRLSETERTVVTLRDLQGFSTTETALFLCISEGAVRTRLHRAHRTLRTFLEPHFARIGE